MPIINKHVLKKSDFPIELVRARFYFEDGQYNHAKDIDAHKSFKDMFKTYNNIGELETGIYLDYNILDIYIMDENRNTYMTDYHTFNDDELENFETTLYSLYEREKLPLSKAIKLTVTLVKL